MSETTLRNLIVGMIILGMLVSGVLSMLWMVETGTIAQNASGEKVDAVPGFINRTSLNAFNASFGRMDSTVKTLADVQTNLSQAQVGDTDKPTLSLAFVSSTWSSVKVIFGMFGVITTFFIELIQFIPTAGGLGWVATYAGALIAVVVIFGIIGYIFGRQE